MICYAIKNDNGEYLAISNQDFSRFWTTIEWAYYFRDIDGSLGKENAESLRDREYLDCKVVKVEIKEIEEWD